MSNIKTEIVLIVDNSGSMQSIKDDTEGGLNNFIAEQKEVPGECTCTYVLFNSKVKRIFTNKDLKEIESIKLSPSGNTSLLDAIGFTINEVGDRHSKLAKKDIPDKVIFVISTDGQENSSVEFKRSQIFDMINHQKEKYQWDFVYLGANQDAILVGQNLGISAKQAVTFDASSIGTRGLYRGLSMSVANSRVSGQSVSYNQAMYQSAVDSVVQESKTDSNVK